MSGPAESDDAFVWRPSHTWLLCIVFVIGTALRLWGLLGFAYWEDELYSITESRQLFSSEFNTGIELRPLYFVIQNLLLKAFGESPLVMRIVPFLFGVAGILAVALLARRVFGSTAAVVAALLTAMAPWPLYSSQIGRYWSLVFCFGALFFWALHRAETTGRLTDYAWACLFALLGLSCHPSFAFPLPAVALALSLVGPDGRMGWRWPSRAAMLGLWVPLTIIVGTWYGATYFLTGTGSFQNAVPAPLGTAGRIVPAIVYAVTPSVVTAAVVGCLICLLGGASASGDERRFGIWAAAGTAGSVGAVIWFAARSQVSAPYVTSVQPLLLVLATAPVILFSRLGAVQRNLATFAFASAIVGGMAPQTASHLLDGTRFDFRPAFQFIHKQGPDGVVALWPVAQAKYYAPEVTAYDIPTNDSLAGLDSLLAADKNFWLIAAYRRYGLVFDPNGLRHRWIIEHCQWRAEFGKSRFDYQDFKLEVHWCGDRANTAVTLLKSQGLAQLAQADSSWSRNGIRSPLSPQPKFTSQSAVPGISGSAAP